MSTLYRGIPDREAPPLTAGTWLTPHAEVAAWYGYAHRYDIDDTLRILDLTHIGIGGDTDAADVALKAAGLDPEVLRTDKEICALVETIEFQVEAESAGYDAVRVMQWHADYSGGPYEALFLMTDQ